MGGSSFRGRTNAARVADCTPVADGALQRLTADLSRAPERARQPEFGVWERLALLVGELQRVADNASDLGRLEQEAVVTGD